MNTMDFKNIDNVKRVLSCFAVEPHQDLYSFHPASIENLFKDGYPKLAKTDEMREFLKLLNHCSQNDNQAKVVVDLSSSDNSDNNLRISLSILQVETFIKHENPAIFNIVEKCRHAVSIDEEQWKQQQVWFEVTINMVDGCKSLTTTSLVSALSKSMKNHQQQFLVQTWLQKFNSAQEKPLQYLVEMIETYFDTENQDKLVFTIKNQLKTTTSSWQELKSKYAYQQMIKDTNMQWEDNKIHFDIEFQ